MEDQWVAAKDLEAGNILTLADGTTAPITKTFGEQLDEPVIVYNFEVADFHTYYVTDTGVLVHNATQNGSCSVEANIPDDYTKDKDGRYHRPNGQYASNAELGLPTTQKPGINSDSIHGNSLEYPGIDYGYVMYNTQNYEILKFGESINPNKRYSKSMLKELNADIKVLVSGTKSDIHLWQHDMNCYFKWKYGMFPENNVKGW